MRTRPEPGRPFRVPGLWGYVSQLGVRPGHDVTVHASLEAPGQVELVRLGQTAILEGSGAADLARDRDDVEILESLDLDGSRRQTTSPGSYVWVDGPPVVAEEITLGAWIRMWMLPWRETAQWYAAGVITDIDYPTCCRFGLLIDRFGRVCAYAGDGGVFDHRRLIVSDASLTSRLRAWTHVACSFGPSGTTIWVDGERVTTNQLHASGTALAGLSARVRIGAIAEGGQADGHIDADVSQPFVAMGVFADDEVRAIVGSRARQRVAEMTPRHRLLGEWLLDEESDDTLADGSGSGRDGIIVNGATWEVGGPVFRATVDDPDYDPRADPDRGHGLRLSSDDLLDCGWPELARFTVPADAASGFYAVRIRLAGTAWSEGIVIPFVVIRTTPTAPGAIALIAPTNTWNAYGRRFDDIPVPAGLHSSFYTAHTNGRPFFQIGVRMPIPRADPYGHDSRRAGRQGHSQLVRPERIAVAWLERDGYTVDCATDLELHQGDVDLDAYACVLLVGHSEYWSDEMRGRIEGYLGRGGRLVSLSGDTASQRVVISDDTSVIEARKISEADPLWLTPEWRGERWHPRGKGRGGQFRSLGRPPWSMLGVSTKGMIDDGTPTSFAPLTLVDPEHPFLLGPEPVVADADGTIGSRSVNGPSVSGYEFDASPEILGFRDDPLPGVTVLARAIGQPNLEWIGAPADQGADAIHWQRPDGGQVFTVSSIGASGALVDEGIGALVRNALHHFGATRVRPPDEP